MRGKGKVKKRRRGKGGNDCDNEAGGERAAKRMAPARNDSWQEDGPWELKNDDYEAYYTRQRICSEDEFPKLLQALRSGLPVAIRVNRMRTGAGSLCSRLGEMQTACAGDPARELYVPHPLPWYPHNLGWQWLGLERRTIQKDKNNKALKDFLYVRELSGLISRQEVVSMVPPLFLGVEPHHLVLDLCAAPGSKTSQMLEVMHWHNCTGNGGPPTGLVLANELVWKRSNMLAHQVQRLGSPCAAVVNMDAQFFPELWVPSDAGPSQLLRFDRVLCDVPCSGDGTMRKTPYIWRSWTRRDGLSLHIRQLGILHRGLELLQVGGRLVYSTCSLNPMEDEAVVAAALHKHDGSVVLVPPPEMPGFKAAHGLKSWVVPDPHGTDFYSDYDSVPKELKENKHKLLPSMFPPPNGDEILNQVHTHCRRMLPHLMDTGGFFAAIFEKRAELKPSARARRSDRREETQAKKQQVAAMKAPAAENLVSETAAASAEPSAAEVVEPTTDAGPPAPAGADGATDVLAAAAAEEEPTPNVATSSDGRIAPTQGLKKLAKEFLQVEDAIWQEIAEFYGLDASLSKQFVMRTEGDKRSEIFFLSAGLERLLRSEAKMPTRMVLCGVVAFQVATSYHERASLWNLARQGLPALVASGMRRRLFASRTLLIKLLRERVLSLSELQEASAQGQLQGLPALQESSSSEHGNNSLRPGSLAVVLHEGEHENERRAPQAPFVALATLSENSLEVAASSAVEVASLLQDLEGQPVVEDILRVPSARDADDDESDGNDADLEPVEGENDDAS